MEIKLPSTLTADYYPGYDAHGETPGRVVLKFGNVHVGGIPVDGTQHGRLTVSGFSGAEDHRRQELDEIVAAWLQSKWFA